jgi:hypothetical protein
MSSWSAHRDTYGGPRNRNNSGHKGKLEEIRANPFRCWAGIWRKELEVRSDLSEVYFLNIDRRKVVPFQVLAAVET